MDLPEIKARLPIQKLAELLGIKAEQETMKWIHCICPFHNDTDPSFVIDKFNQTARCLSPACTAVNRMDHIGLVQMCEHLPRELAIDRLYILAGEDRPINSLHEILHRVLERLTPNLAHDVPSEFFNERGISPEALKELLVGYSPSYAWFQGCIKDIPSEEAAKLELFRSEMFDNAIIYPTFDGLGRAAGFRSRPFRSLSKYIGNTKDFPLKTSRLYAMYLVKNRQIVLVEGPNDVLGLRSVGVKNVAGLMGLHLNDLEDYLMECGFSDVILITDGDNAGRIATLQAPDLMRVTQVPNGMDPDEYAKKEGVVGIANLIENAKYPLEIKINARLSRLVGKDTPPTLTNKIMLVKAIAKDISDGIPSIIISKLQDKIASALEVSKEDVVSLFELVEYDSTDLEEKIVWHLFEKGEYSNDIKSKITANFFSNMKYRGQYSDMLGGLSPSEQPVKREGLTEGDIDRFIDIVKRRQTKRILKRATYSALNLSESLDSVLNITLGKIASISTESIPVINALQQLDIGIHNALERSKNPNQLLGLSFGNGFGRTDGILQGLRPSSIYVLSAKQGTGKSALALQWAKNMAFDQGIPILWFSLEMNALDMSARLLAQLTGIPALNIMKGALDVENDVPTLVNQSIKHCQAPFYMANCGALTINQLVAVVMKYKALKDIRAVFIDYIQLLDSGQKFHTMYEDVGHISGMIKSQITQSMGLPVLAIAQLNRPAAKRDLPTAEDVGESYKISQDCDVFMTLRQFTPDEVEQNEKDRLNGKTKINWGNMLLNIDKQRSGLDKQKIGLIFNKETLSLKEAN